MSEELVSQQNIEERLADIKLMAENWLKSYCKIAESAGYDYLLADFEEEIDSLCSVLYTVWKRKLITQKEYQEVTAYCWEQVFKFKTHLGEINRQDDFVNRLTGG